MMRKIFFGVIIFLLLIFTSCVTYESLSGTVRENEDGTYSITYLNPDTIGEELTIPSRYKGKKITMLKENAIQDCNTVKKIEIPDTITTLDSACINNCRNLESVYIGAGVKTISPYTFAHTPSLAEIEISKNNSCFYVEGNCLIEKGTNILVQGTINSVIPNKVIKIGDSAFDGLNIKNVDIPASVTSIGHSAFFATGLNELTIPESVIELKEAAFGNSLLREIVLPDSIVSIPRDLFWGCEYLRYLKIGAGVTEIGRNAFAYCYSLEEIEVSENNPIYRSEENCIIEKEDERLILCGINFTIPASVQIMGTSCIEDSEIETDKKNIIVIPSGVELIEMNAINCYGNISEIYIPASVTEIQPHAVITATNASKTIVKIYCEAISKPSGWDEGWKNKSGYSEVIWGYTVPDKNCN